MAGKKPHRTKHGRRLSLKGQPAFDLQPTGLSQAAEPSSMREDPRLFSIQKDAQKNVDSYLSSGTDPSLASMEDVHGSAEHQKIYDAQSMVLFISNSWRLQRNEWLLWVMNHMFRNVVPKEEKDSCFEVIELSTQPLQFWKESNASVDDCHTPKHEEDVNFWACNQASPPSQEEDLSTNLLPAFRIVPQTQIFTIYHSYAVVFLLDLSSSISTIDAYTHQLQVDQVMETFHKCVRGITPPFIVPSSYHREHFHFQPRLYISVLCDCTPFPASQLQDASASSIRVLLQNAVLTLENVEVTLAYVNQKVTELQSEMACTYASRLQQCPLPPESFETAPNRFLEAGALSLRLLPQDSSPVLVLITDGVAEFGRGEHGIGLRWMAREGVLLTVIQVGSSLGFTPACSFGYVPDNESLRFLAMATGGKFLYAADCPTFPGGPCPKATYPNFYHCMFLIQDACFQKDRPLNRHATVNVGQERMVDLPVHRLLNPQPESLASNWLQEATSGGFPWYVESHPPPTDLLLTRYRDYALPLETSCVLNARLREGFFIERILLSGSHQNRAEKIHVNLAMTWLPNVVIQYRIRAQLPSDFKASQPSRKYLRIEMNILAPTVFAVSFVNLDATAEPATSLLANVASLHAFLRSIFATDDTLKSLSTMLQQFPMLKAPRDRDPSNNTIAPALLQKLDVDAVKSLWSSFENSRLDYISNGLFDHHSAILTAVEPTLSSDFRLADLAEYLANLDYHSISETTYIKYLYAQKPGQLNFPSFCILRLQLLSGSLLWSRLVFINVRYSVRKVLSQKHVATYACIKETFTVRCCRRPLHSLLVTQPLTHDLIRRTDQLIPSKYLLESRTHRWLSSNDHDPYFPAQGLPTIHHLAFSLLARAKLAQGFVRIGAQGHCQLFYKELACGKCFGMQYQLEMEDLRVLSRVWVEPITGDAFENQSQRSIDDVLRQDERVVSNLFAFDQIHYACRQKLNLFQASVRLGSLALNSVALVSTYKLPMLSANPAQDLLTAQRDLAILGRSSHFRPLADEASCSPLGHPLNYPLKLTLTEDEYFQLSPLIANLLLFQFFMESAVMLACDAAVTAQTDDSCPTFLPWIHPLGQAVPQVSSLRWGFAKKLSPVTFALVFVPKVEDLLQAYWDASSHTGDVASLPTMGLLTYECIREDLNCASPKTSTQAGENLHSFNQSAHASNRYPFIPAVPALHNVIATPERLELWAKGSKSCPTVALKVHALHASFDAIHARAFVQATYAAMLQGHAVPSQDILAVLDLCQVLTLTVSLTDYLNLKVEKERRNLDQEDIRERAEQKLQRKFAALIGYHFGEVATEGWRGTYFFKTPQKPNIHLWDYENLGSSHSKDNLAQEEPRSLPHLLAQAAHPMFMTLNLCYHNPRCDPPSTTMVTTILPSHYPALESGHDFSPASIGTHASPLESCDGTWAKVQLRLHVPLTLGQLRGEGEACQIISQVLASDDFLKHAMVDQLLPKDHLRALAETRSRLEWLIKEEAIHGLLTWSPIDAPVLRWIDRKLSVRNPFVDFPSSFSMSLKFVDKAAGQELFTRELEHLFIHPYCILRSEEYFYVQPIRPPAAGSDLSSLSSLLQDSGKRSGLGISVAEASGAEVAAPNFWMLLVPNAEHVQISFFSKSVAGVERSRIIQRIRRKIAQLLRQVNQQVLLDELDASRFCSRYLIPPDASDEAAESASSESDGEFVGESFDDESCSLAKSLSISDFSEDLQLQVGPTKFRSGQFQCPLQFCEVFALHWRIKPQMALDHILASVMHPFSVSNRQNLFVIRDSASVFYLRLKEAKLPAKPDPSDLLEATFEAALPSFNRPNSRYPPFSACSSVVGPNTELRGLVLEVYGMHTPGRGIKEELVSLIEGRLVGHLTLNIISSYLARNATLKLTPADVHFIFPLRQHPKPMATATHPLHYPFLNPVLTMFYIKQNLLQYLHILAGSEARLQYRQLCHQQYQLPATPDADSCDCFGGDFTFFYNCIASRSPTPIEQQLGQGLGTVCLTLTNPTTGCVMFQHNEDHQLGSKPSAPTPPPLEFVPSDVPTSYRIHIDVWTVGSVEPEALLTQVMASIRQSSCDYLLDCCIQRFVNELSLLGDRRVSHGHSDKDLPEFALEDGLPNVDVDSPLVRSNVDVDSHLVRPNVNVNSHLLRPIAAIIADGKQLNNPAMLCLQVPCALTSSSQKLLVTQVHDWLGELNAQLNPVIFNGQGEAVGAPRLAAEAFPTCPEDNEPGTYILLSGLPELVANHGRSLLRDLTEPESTPTRRNSLEDIASVKSGKPSAPRKDRPLEDLMLYPPLSYPHQCQKLTGTRLELARRHFIGFVVEGSCVKLYTANLARTFLEQLRGLVERSLAWQRSRTSLLDLILQQKMGLFHQQYEIVGQLLPSPRNSASQSHLRGSLELHRLGLVIRNPSLGRVRTGIDVRAKPFEPQEPIDNISMASANDEACRPEPHRFSQINRVLTYPPDASFTEVSTDTCQIDYLQIHGQGFLDQYRKLLTYSPHELEPAQVSLFQASSPFSDRFASNDPEALALLVQSAHLVHFCRTPLFRFKLADSRSIDGDLLFNESSQDDSFTNWYRLVTERFNQVYGAYLERMGLQPVPKNPPEARLASSPAFYTKRMCGNMIIVSLDIKSMFVRIDIYAMVLGAPSPTAWQGFLKECARLKSITHAHSFVYDFHLLILQEWLDGRLDSIPKVNLISICSALLKSPLTMGNYSCNRLTSGHLVPSSFNARDIYHYIIRSPLRYGVRNIYCDNRPVGFFIAEDLPPSVRRLIILTPSDTPGGPAFLYNDLVVHKDSFQSFPAAPNQSPLGSLTLRSPEAVILAQLDEVLKLHHIDALWKQLQADDAELDVVEIERLTNEFSHLDLIQIEPSFAELTQMGLDWHRALDSLIQIYPKMCRGRIQPRHPSSEQEGRHVLFFNPYDSHHLIHFCLSTAGLHVSAVSRDPRADLKVVECEHVTSILRTLFYSMWQSFHNSPL